MDLSAKIKSLLRQLVLMVASNKQKAEKIQQLEEQLEAATNRAVEAERLNGEHIITIGSLRADLSALKENSVVIDPELADLIQHTQEVVDAYGLNDAGA